MNNVEGLLIEQYPQGELPPAQVKNYDPTRH